MGTDATAESVASLVTWTLWAAVGVAVLFYFASSYLFEVLAQKHEEPRWMAWVPFANALLMMRLVGWEKWFWTMIGGYVLAIGGMFLPGPLMFVGFVAIFPVAIGAFLMSLLYFPVLAKRRGLGMGIGATVILPQVVPPFVELMMPGWGIWVSLLASLSALAAFLTIVFHDGRPAHGPHPIGYALSALALGVAALAVHALPARLADEEGFRQALQELAVELEAGPLARIGSLAGMTSGDERDDGSVSREPRPVEISEVCPHGAREVTEAEGRARAWWCEVETADGWVRHGPSRSWHDNGYLDTEGVYEHGRRAGTWTRHWRSGGRRAQADFVDDLQHGWMHRWDAYGSYQTRVWYEYGQAAGG